MSSRALSAYPTVPASPVRSVWSSFPFSAISRYNVTTC